MSQAVQYANVVFVCLLLAVLTVMIHMCGLYMLRRWIHRLVRTENFHHHVMRETYVVSALVLGLCVIHIAEIMVWATGYVSMGALQDYGDAVYYSLTTYTTVGPDGVSVGRTYRGVAGFESLLGPMMMAWSTAALVGYVTQVMSANLHPPHAAPSPQSGS
ncbi:ion channel [Xanthobacter sp. V4C-4]|uniref:ion channel n=1 Tax=Xanthobacter cornucopiae TaxID=3119924 RepID=UPI0037281012